MPIDLVYDPVSYAVPVPQSKPDITSGDVSFSDRLWNTVTGVFEEIVPNLANVEYQKYMMDRLGFQMQDTNTYAAEQKAALAGQQTYAQSSLSQSQMMIYAAAAGLFALGLVFAVKR